MGVARNRGIGSSDHRVIGKPVLPTKSYRRSALLHSSCLVTESSYRRAFSQLKIFYHVSDLMDEKIYHCEVRKLYRIDGIKERKWVEMPVKKALEEGATEFRCKDCHGAVKLHGKNVTHGP